MNAFCGQNAEFFHVVRKVTTGLLTRQNNAWYVFEHTVVYHA